jgi:hypothetical protein
MRVAPTAPCEFHDHLITKALLPVRCTPEVFSTIVLVDGEGSNTIDRARGCGIASVKAGHDEIDQPVEVPKIDCGRDK